MTGDEASMEAGRRIAGLGKARCQMEKGETDAAIQAADAAIGDADPEDAEVLAAAYNLKGIALARAGKKQEALFALLRVDTLYSEAREAHAEALYHLVPLWKELKRPDRAQEAQNTLGSQYKETHWYKSLPR